jgi:hypothetical protein
VCCVCIHPHRYLREQSKYFPALSPVQYHLKVSPLHYTHYTTTPLHHYTTPLHYITSHHTTSHYITSHYITSHYTTLHYTTLHYTTLLRHITSHYITSHHITLHHTTSHYTSTQCECECECECDERDVTIYTLNFIHSFFPHITSNHSGIRRTQDVHH